MIIETTKQDEIDELKFRSKQEIDSLNHIIGKIYACIIISYYFSNFKFVCVKMHYKLI
jgi:hypothetical protein